MGNNLGIKGKEVSSSKLKQLFEQFANKEGKIEKKSAISFLKALAIEIQVDFSNFKAEEIILEVDPQGKGLDFGQFNLFFLGATGEALEEGNTSLSDSMNSSGKKI